MGRDDITLGGITVKEQTLALINNWWYMIGGSSGFLGLGSTGYGVNLSSTTADGRVKTHKPLFVNMHQQHLIKPYFSLALDCLSQNVSRGSGGYLTLSDLAPVALGSCFTVVRAEISEDVREDTDPDVTGLAWNLSVKGVTVGESSNTTEFQVTVCPTVAVSNLPQSVADQVNEQFKPAGAWNKTHQRYHVNCAAQASSVGIRIGNETFIHDPTGLIQFAQDGFCILTIGRPVIEQYPPGLIMATTPSFTSLGLVDIQQFGSPGISNAGAT